MSTPDNQFDFPSRDRDRDKSDGESFDFKKLFRGPLIWVLLGLALMALAWGALSAPRVSRIETSDGLALLQGHTVRSALMVDGEQRVELELTEPFVVNRDGEEIDHGTTVDFLYTEPQGPTIVDAVQHANLVDGHNSEVPTAGLLSSILGIVLPFALIAGLFWFLMSRMQGGNSRVMGFGKSRAKLITKDMPQVTFQDVAGVDEAVEELYEIKDFLADPARFQAVGAKIPKGVLLYGPPGTGKTLLARAVAGEAGVPFYTISGSDFVEMFVGVGASRVRDLFAEAKANAPAIIFVDEIDAVGRHRGAGMGGGHDEREQTLNQMLVEMDGFDQKTNVILIAATNRPDILDPALLRPGRFDRQIAVDAPDLVGREAILRVHAKGKPMVPSVDLAAVARRTPGMTGADLANVLNEAALLTARSGAQLIDDRALDEAIDRVIAGPQKRTRVMNAREQKITAYHEGGHALVAAAMRYTDPVTKVTILPRGRALGYTMVMPTEDKYSTTRNELLDQLAYAMGGRVAEEIIFHDPTTGASNDIEKATGIARKMVTEYGMSEAVGAVKLGTSDSEPFMGRNLGHTRDYSEDIAATVDVEVRKLIESAHDEAWEVLTEYRPVLDDLVLRLLEKETLNQAELAEVFAPIVKREPRDVWLSSEQRTIDTRPPVLTPTEAALEAQSVAEIEAPHPTAAEMPYIDPKGEQNPASVLAPPVDPRFAVPEPVGQVGIVAPAQVVSDDAVLEAEVPGAPPVGVATGVEATPGVVPPQQFASQIVGDPGVEAVTAPMAPPSAAATPLGDADAFGVVEALETTPLNGSNQPTVVGEPVIVRVPGAVEEPVVVPDDEGR